MPRGVVDLDCPMAGELIRCYKRVTSVGGTCRYVLEEDSDLLAYFIHSGALYGLPTFHDFDSAVEDFSEKGESSCP